MDPLSGSVSFDDPQPLSGGSDYPAIPIGDYGPPPSLPVLYGGINAYQRPVQNNYSTVLPNIPVPTQPGYPETLQGYALPQPAALNQAQFSPVAPASYPTPPHLVAAPMGGAGFRPAGGPGAYPTQAPVPMMSGPGGIMPMRMPQQPPMPQPVL